MTLESIKEAYKSETINMNNMIGKPETKMSQEDLDKMCNDIDETITLQEFMDVVGAWSKDSIRVGAATVILKRIVDLHEQ